MAWDCVDCHRNNWTVRFLITYQLVSGSIYSKTVTVDKDVRHANITGLKKFSNYSIAVLAVTSRGSGVPSAIIFEQTKEDGRYSPPELSF